MLLHNNVSSAVLPVINEGCNSSLFTFTALPVVSACMSSEIHVEKYLNVSFSLVKQLCCIPYISSVSLSAHQTPPFYLPVTSHFPMITFSSFLSISVQLYNLQPLQLIWIWSQTLLKKKNNSFLRGHFTVSKVVFLSVVLKGTYRISPDKLTPQGIYFDSQNSTYCSSIIDTDHSGCGC